MNIESNCTVATSAQTRRSVLSVAIAVIATIPIAAGPASADHSFTSPASDNGCGVDLQADATHGSGRARIGYGDITITNLETGATYLQRSRYTATETFEPSTGSTHSPDRRKLFGSVCSPETWDRLGWSKSQALELLVSGRLKFTLNNEFVVTAFSLNGTYDDLCALLTD